MQITVYQKRRQNKKLSGNWLNRHAWMVLKKTQILFFARVSQHAADNNVNTTIHYFDPMGERGTLRIGIFAAAGALPGAPFFCLGSFFLSYLKKFLLPETWRKNRFSVNFCAATNFLRFIFPLPKNIFPVANFFPQRHKMPQKVDRTPLKTL